MRRMGDVILDGVEAERHALRSPGGRHDEIADDGAPGQDFRARSRLGGDQDLIHLGAVDCAERLCAHVAPPPVVKSRATRSQERSSSARIEAKTSRNIAVGQHARVGVVARAMIAVEQARPHCLQSVARPMREGKVGRSRPERAQHRVVRHSSEREHDLEIGERVDRLRQIGATGRDLLRRRLVLRRGAADSVDDGAIDEFKAVVGPPAVDARGEAEPNERFVEEVAGVVAGERDGPFGSLPGGPARARRS